MKRRPTAVAALDSSRSAAEARALHDVARQGVSGTTGRYPYAGAIQRSFGRYAPTGLRAHFGPAARQAADALSAHAFVWNGEVAFGERPSLHTAAHEAAHLVGQARGASGLRYGVGALGDAGERLAERAASAVVAGRSAEPLFASALAGAPTASAGPGLQMLNRIVDSKSKHATFPTPWAELATELSLTNHGKAKMMLQINKSGRYQQMVNVLGNSCERAEKVYASIDGQRKGGVRKADAIQTAYGALGTFMTELTNTATPAGKAAAKKLEFEGGHLISDKILGDDSYVEANFAPQRRQLNSPIFRKIEEIAEGGTAKKDPSVTAAKPNWSMTSEVTYPLGSLALDSQDVMATMGLDSTDLAKPAPKTINLTHRVPWRWNATIDSGSPDYVFTKVSSIDAKGATPQNRSGAAFGFLPTEADVINRQGDTSSTFDSVFWSMDSLSFTPLGGGSTKFNTGSGSDRASRHTFTAVQSTPLGQRKSLGKAAVAVAKKGKAAGIVKLRKYKRNLVPVGLSLNKAKAVAEQVYKENSAEFTRAGVTKSAIAIGVLGVSLRRAKREAKESFSLAQTTNWVRTWKKKGGGKAEHRVAALAALLQAIQDSSGKPAWL